MPFSREKTINPYVPDRVYSLGDNSGQFSDQDIGKAVKYGTDSAMVLCASGDDIVGFVAAVEPGTMDGYSIGAVTMDIGCEEYAADEAGSLSVGDVVTAGTAGTLGTADTDFLQNVLVDAAVAYTGHHWQVVEVYGTGAGRKVLLRKV